jgi:ribosome-associated toxin RatA of RatAB toxin-antitoxin module
VADIRRSARVPYSAQQMLDLVNDIDAYPEFLHWCHAARIEKRDGAVVEAALEIGISGIHKTMRTRNATSISNGGDQATVAIRMLNGPLKRLHGAWEFSDVAGGGCDVVLELEYETHRTPFGLLLRTLFDEIAHSQLNAFTARARQVYGSE